LVQVELFDREILVIGRWEFLEDSIHYELGFGAFLNVRKDLVDLIRNDVSVLVLSDSSF
jgi:hypothetical protein